MPARRPQLDLFGGAADDEVRAVDDEGARALAARLPRWLRFGTSSWTFPGWAGIVYAGRPTAAQLVASGLSAYARHPLLRTVGIDRSYYAPLTDADLTTIASQLPPGFVATAKVWDEATTLVFPRHPRYGARAGTRNPRFLDPAIVVDSVALPWTRFLGDRAGPLFLEIAPVPRGEAIDPGAFASSLDRFLAEAPSRVRWAVEVRNRELLSRAYFEVLARHGAAHVLNFWTAMPAIGEQLSLPGVLGADFAVARLLLPPGARYEEARDTFAPFDRIVAPQPRMREDVVRLALACARAGKDLFVIVNNKAEGSSPLTVRALAGAVADAIEQGTL